MTTWRKLISQHFVSTGETWDDVVRSHADGSLDAEFDADYGVAEGCAFTLWTKKRVYFPTVYDGQEWVSSVPRDPCGEATDHVGSE